MKLEKLVGDRFKERPADCQVDSHALMIRGGYMKNMANGIYSSYMPLKRITRKIEQIIREEMDAIDGQEVQSRLLCRQVSGRNLADTTASEKNFYVLQTEMEHRWFLV